MDKIWSNVMVRNEPLVVPCLLSTINAVDKHFVIDTGSDDGTWERLCDLWSQYPNKIQLEQRKIDNCHAWSNVSQVNVTGISDKARLSLGKLRDEMCQRTNAEWILIQDGDEFHPPECVTAWKNWLKSPPTDCLWLPFIDFIYNFTKVRHIHGMCRLFRKDVTDVIGAYPEEMHRHIPSGITYDKDRFHTSSIVGSLNSSVWHFESILKPWRKNKQVVLNLGEFELPQIIRNYKDLFDKLMKDNNG